jgi:Ribosomal L29e protein family
MAKSKNHTSHNQSNKAHKNGAPFSAPLECSRDSRRRSLQPCCRQPFRRRWCSRSAGSRPGCRACHGAALVGVRRAGTASAGLAAALPLLAGVVLQQRHFCRRRIRLAGGLRAFRPPRPRVGIWPPLAAPPALTCALFRSGIKKAPKQRYSSTKGVRAKPGQPRDRPPGLIICAAGGAQVPAERQVRTQAQREGPQLGISSSAATSRCPLARRVSPWACVIHLAVCRANTLMRICIAMRAHQSI